MKKSLLHPICVLFFLFASVGIGGQIARAEDEIDQLIEQLGDDSAAVRENAQSTLINKIREADHATRAAILKKVRKATHDPDPERGARATAIVEATKRRAGEVSFETNAATDGEISLRVTLENGPGDNLCSVQIGVGGQYTPQLKLELLEEAIQNSKDADCKAIQIVDLGGTTLVLKAKGAKKTRIKNIELEDNSVQETNTAVFDVDAAAIWRARCVIFPLRPPTITSFQTGGGNVSLRINGVSAVASSTDALGNPRDVEDIAQELFDQIQGGEQFENLRDKGLGASLENSTITVTAPFNIILAFEPVASVNAILFVEVTTEGSK
jgi:hypothetical protein